MPSFQPNANSAVLPRDTTARQEFVQFNSTDSYLLLLNFNDLPMLILNLSQSSA